MAPRIHHVAIRVHDIEAAREFLQDGFGFEFGVVESHPELGVLTSMDASGLELVAPANAESPLAATLDRRGEGLNLLALQVDDLDDAIGRLELLGVRVAQRVSVDEGEIALISPEHMFAGLVQLYESHNAAADGSRPT